MTLHKFLRSYSTLEFVLMLLLPGRASENATSCFYSHNSGFI